MDDATHARLVEWAAHQCGCRVINAMPLQGGYINFVWRLILDSGHLAEDAADTAAVLEPVTCPAASRSAILKHSPPYIASNPGVPFFTARAGFEVAASDLIHALGVCDACVAVPRVLAFDASLPAILQQDAGPLPTLDAWLQTQRQAGDAVDAAAVAAAVGGQLGRFVGRLHALSAAAISPAASGSGEPPPLKLERARYNNLTVQQVRQAVQYGSMRTTLAAVVSECGLEVEVPDSAVGAVGAACEALGALLVRACDDAHATPQDAAVNMCFTMGDLWPRSVLVDAAAVDRLRLWVIDLEFSHVGSPAQDVAHFAAHAWMLHHVARTHSSNSSGSSSDVSDSDGGACAVVDEAAPFAALHRLLFTPAQPPAAIAAATATAASSPPAPTLPAVLWCAFLQHYTSQLSSADTPGAAVLRAAWASGRVEAIGAVHAGAEILARLGAYRAGGPYDRATACKHVDDAQYKALVAHAVRTAVRCILAGAPALVLATDPTSDDAAPAHTPSPAASGPTL